MFGQNPIRKPVKGDGTLLDVEHIFKTFQGEGPFVGYPAIFIRLGGCNLACDFCDTEFESFKAMHLEDIIKQVNTLSGKEAGHTTHPLVVISGGEPLRQPIEALCDALLAQEYTVQIETNGTLFRTLNSRVHIICSPKHTGSGYHRIREDLLPHITAFKFIISATHPHYQTIAEVGQGDYNIPVYVQAMDEYDAKKNAANLQKAVRLSQALGLRIGFQTHKIADVE